jgi:hypothetical protein
VTTIDADHAARLGKLAAARAEEKEGRRLRREGRDEEAIELYDRASDLYGDSGLAWDGHGESELANEVRRAIERCKKIASNIRNPKDQRASATTPRPNCLACEKPLRRYKLDGSAFDDGTPREWGDYGDNRFCGLRCGWRWACRRSPMPKLPVRSALPRASDKAERKTS